MLSHRLGLVPIYAVRHTLEPWTRVAGAHAHLCRMPHMPRTPDTQTGSQAGHLATHACEPRLGQDPRKFRERAAEEDADEHNVISFRLQIKCEAGRGAAAAAGGLGAGASSFGTAATRGTAAAGGGGGGGNGARPLNSQVLSPQLPSLHPHPHHPPLTTHHSTFNLQPSP